MIHLSQKLKSPSQEKKKNPKRYIPEDQQDNK